MNQKNTETKRLDWDSNFFGIEIGTTHVKSNEFELEKSSFDLIYLYSKEPLNNSKHPCYDKKITFSKKITTETIFHKKKEIQTYNGSLNQSLLDLTFSSGHHSRFKKDPKLTMHFKNLYTLWIKNSLNKQLADHTFIYQINKEIMGFLTLKKKENFHQIGLIATSEKSRGKGIGSTLIQRAEQQVQKENGKEIRVVTQLDNTMACNFYKKNKFTKYSLEYIYHLWI